MKESPLQKILEQSALEPERINERNREHFWKLVDKIVIDTRLRTGIEVIIIGNDNIRLNTKGINNYLSSKRITTEEKNELASQLEGIIQIITLAFSLDCGMDPEAKTLQDSTFLNICIRLNKILMDQGYGNKIDIAIDIWTTVNRQLLKHSSD